MMCDPQKLQAPGRSRRVRLAALAGYVLTILFCSICLNGCVKNVYLYPICFYQTAPQQQRLENYYSPQLLAGLSATLKGSGQVNAAVTPDGRWLVTYLTTAQSNKIAKVWPRIGCIGNALDSQSTKQEADCVAYILEFVRAKNYFAFGNARDVGGFDIWNESPVKNTVVHCHQIKEDELQ